MISDWAGAPVAFPLGMIHPAPALVARADTTIEDCVRLMRKHDIGSILVVSDDGREDLVGIFTERDLLRKIDLIHGGEHWRRPVRTVMTQPVRTIELEDLTRAAMVMLQNGIRHLPVTSGGKLLGMVSMRDLFKRLATRPAEGATSGLNKGEFRVSILSRDEGVHKLLRGAHAMIDRKSEVKALPGLDRLVAPDDPDLLVIDIDGYAPKEWAGALKEVLRTRNGRLTVVVFSPARHAEKSVEILEELSASGSIGAFAKPVDLNAFSALLRGD